MSDYSTNYMSNTARMLGFAMGGTQMHLDNLKYVISSLELSAADRNALLYSVKCLEKKQAIVDLWWQKRTEENVTVEALEAEIDSRDIVQLERA